VRAAPGSAGRIRGELRVSRLAFGKAGYARPGGRWPLSRAEDLGERSRVGEELLLAGRNQAGHMAVEGGARAGRRPLGPQVLVA
jgi:hypothetical protein